MRKILVPLDGSACAERALEAARPLASLWNGQLLLLRAQDFYVRGPLGDVPSQAVRWPNAGVRAYLEKLAEQLEREGYRVRALVRSGRPGPKILQVARRESADAVVMSSHGRTGPARWLLGSVTAQVLRRAACPVLVVRAGAPPVPEDGFRRPLVPVDGSGYSYQVVGQIGPFLSRGACPKLVWATNLTPLDLDASERQACIKAMRTELAQTFPDREWDVLDGDAAATILDDARQEGRDLIAMATHGRTGFKRFLLGSVTERVVRHAPCAVLVFPPTSRILSVAAG